MRAGPCLAAEFAVHPVRFTCVCTAGPVGGERATSVRASECAGCAVVGRSDDRRHRDRIGFAFDAGGGKELTHVFAALYVIGCLIAILVVRQSGLFTAVVQPPMILFVSVPGAYYLFHGAKLNGLKDVVINCAYPLIERFPLMLVTSGAVLLIGLVRWFVGSSRSATDAEPTEAATTGPFAAVTAKIAGMFSRRTTTTRNWPRSAAIASTGRHRRARHSRPGPPTAPSRSRTPHPRASAGERV